MWELIHSFGAGIAFAVGVCSGAILCQLANQKGREEFIADMKAEREAIEQRLGLQVEHLGAIAESVANIAEWKARESA